MATLAIQIAIGIGSALLGGVIAIATAGAGRGREGPRLNELNVSTSTYGSPIKIVFGTMRIGGNIIWAADLVETRIEEKVGGKGGSVTQVSYTYHADFAIGICEGEVKSISRIWADSVLIYDTRAQIGAEGYVASLDLEGTITVYSGTETQTPDATMQSYLGTDDTPAHRGLAYIVFNNLALEKFGNRIPNITAEVVLSGDVATDKTSLLSYNTDIGHTYFVIASANKEGPGPVNGNNPVIFSYVDGLIRVGELDSLSSVQMYNLEGNLVAHTTRTAAEQLFQTDSIQDTGYCPGGLLSNDSYFRTHWTTVRDNITFGAASTMMEVIQDGVKVFDFKDLLPSGAYFGGITPCADKEHVLLFTAPTASYVSTGTSPSVVDTWYIANWDGEQATIVSQGSCNPVFNVEATDFGQTASHDWGAHMMEEDLTTIWNHHVSAGAVQVSYREIDSNNNFDVNGVFSSSYAVSASSGKGGVWANKGVSIIISANRMWVHTKASLVSSAAPTVGVIVSSIADKAGLGSEDLSLGTLTRTIEGYCITRQMSARAAIEPLQTAQLFDIIESDNKLKGVYRGSAIATAIASSELGAGSGNTMELLEYTRAQDVELPKRISVSHVDPTADYNVNLQYAARQITESVNDVKLDLAIALTPTEAIQIAEKQLFMIWQGRDTYKFNLSTKYAYLEPGDVITISERGRTIIMRISTVSLGASILECTAISEDPDLYTSYVSGADVSFIEQSLSIDGPTNLVHMDIPLLRSVDDDSGYYAAMGGYTSGWPGCVYFRSDDGGDIYNQITAQGAEAEMGLTTDVLASGITTIWDYTNTVNVRMISGDPESANASAVINGANVALVGNEIIAYQDVTQESNGTYTLSKLLRGLRGTEGQIGSHSIGDQFVILTTSTIIRYDPGSSLIGLSRYYKAVTINRFEIETDEVIFTNNANGLKPYSPAHFTASALSNDDLGMSWVRRERTDGEWRDYVDVPLSETSELYEIDFLSSAQGSVLSTVSGLSSTEYTYNTSAQTADYGALPATVYANLYQMSSIVGRGYTASQIFTIVRGVESYSDLVLGDGPVAYWRLGTSGSTEADEIGSNDGTVAGPAQASGLLINDSNQAREFQVSIDRITVAPSTTIDDIFSGGGTVEAWINASSAGAAGFGRIFEKASTSADGWFLAVESSSGETHFKFGQYASTIGEWTSPNNSLVLSSTHHIAVLYNNASVVNNPRIFIDGVSVLATEVNTPTNPISSDAGQIFNIGNRVALDRNFDGVIDEAAFYSSSLTDKQISEHYNRGIGYTGYSLEVMSDNPVAYWRLGTASSIEPDEVGSNDGTVTGAVQADGLLANDTDKAREFEASTDVITVAASVTIENIFDSGGTAEVWVNASSIGSIGGRIFSTRVIGSKTGWECHVFDDGGGLYMKFVQEFNTTVGVWNTPDNSIIFGDTYHIVISYNADSTGNTPSIYLNGVLASITEATTPSGTRGSDAGTDLRIGNIGTVDRNFDGVIDEPALYDYILSSAEVTAHYNAR